jgi:hypothetical protein
MNYYPEDSYIILLYSNARCNYINLKLSKKHNIQKVNIKKKTNKTNKTKKAKKTKKNKNSRKLIGFICYNNIHKITNTNNIKILPPFNKKILSKSIDNYTNEMKIGYFNWICSNNQFKCVSSILIPKMLKHLKQIGYKKVFGIVEIKREYSQKLLNLYSKYDFELKNEIKLYNSRKPNFYFISRNL